MLDKDANIQVHKISSLTEIKSKEMDVNNSFSLIVSLHELAPSLDCFLSLTFWGFLLILYLQKYMKKKKINCKTNLQENKLK